MNESRMNGMRVSLSCCCKHLLGRIGHIINPCFIIHNLYPCTSPFPPQNGATCLMSLLRATAWILQMSCEIFLARCDGAAVKGNRTSATEARTVIKRKKRWRWRLQDERRRYVLVMYWFYMWCVSAVHSNMDWFSLLYDIFSILLGFQ